LKWNKISCNQGGCGVCTITISIFEFITQQIKHRPVTSFLICVGQLPHTSIATNEAVGNIKDGINPIQKSIVLFHGTQF
jgi:xanthine dehydrogenase/oxidase